MLGILIFLFAVVMLCIVVFRVAQITVLFPVIIVLTIWKNRSLIFTTALISVSIVCAFGFYEWVVSGGGNLIILKIIKWALYILAGTIATLVVVYFLSKKPDTRTPEQKATAERIKHLKEEAKKLGVYNVEDEELLKGYIDYHATWRMPNNKYKTLALQGRCMPFLRNVVSAYSEYEEHFADEVWLKRRLSQLDKDHFDLVTRVAFKNFTTYAELAFAETKAVEYITGYKFFCEINKE